MVDLEERVQALEHRLEAYHEALTEAVKENDRLALDAAWGVHFALYRELATIAIFALAYLAYDQVSWILAIAIMIAVFPMQLAVHAWSNGQRMKEVEKLKRIPEWE